jgi:hypothetical protein
VTFKAPVKEVADVVVVAVEVAADAEVPALNLEKANKSPKALEASKSAPAVEDVVVVVAEDTATITRTLIVVVLRITTSLELVTSPTRPRRVAVDTETGVVLRKALKIMKDTRPPTLRELRLPLRLRPLRRLLPLPPPRLLLLRLPLQLPPPLLLKLRLRPSNVAGTSTRRSRSNNART